MSAYKSIWATITFSFFASFFPQVSSAGVLDIDTFGLSIHLDGSYNKAPLRLDSEGEFVFNPGIGLGYDFRENAVKSGFSPIVKAGSFADCNAVLIYYTTAGIRYSYIFLTKFYIPPLPVLLLPVSSRGLMPRPKKQSAPDATCSKKH